MKIYIAGKYQEREFISRMMDTLRDAGHEITTEWTSHEYATPEIHASYAVDDIRGVQECDIYIGIFLNEHRYRGALCELGAALALGKPCWILGHAEDDCIFMLHPLVFRFDEKDLEDWLKSSDCYSRACKVNI